MQVNNAVTNTFKVRYLPTARDVMGFRNRLGGIEDYIPSLSSISDVLTQIGTYRTQQAAIQAEVEMARIAAAKKTAPAFTLPNAKEALDSGMGITANTVLLGAVGLGALFLLTRKGR